MERETPSGHFYRAKAQSAQRKPAMIKRIKLISRIKLLAALASLRENKKHFLSSNLAIAARHVWINPGIEMEWE